MRFSTSSTQQRPKGQRKAKGVQPGAPRRRSQPPSRHARRLADAARAAGLVAVTLDGGTEGEAVELHRADGAWLATYRPRTRYYRGAGASGKLRSWRHALALILRPKN